MFDNQPRLRGHGLSLMPLKPEDFSPLFKAASDPVTWAGHPATDRYERDVFRAYFDMLLARGGTLSVTDDATGDMIGCSRYYTAPDRPGTIGIGFTFLHHSYWGGATNFALKSLMLDHAFASFDDVWFHIATTNLRSQKATAKLGAQAEPDADLDLSGRTETWKTYRLPRTVWQDVKARR